MSDSNSTMDKGAVVIAKRGFQIVRHKHHGRAFVNSSSLNANNQEWCGFSKPIPEQMKFVTQKNPAGRKKRRERNRTTITSEEEDLQDKRAGPNGTASKKAYDSRATENFELQQTSDCSSISTEEGTDISYPWTVFEACHLFDEDIIPGLSYQTAQCSIDRGLEDWSLQDLPNDLSEQDKKFFNSYIKSLYLTFTWPFETLSLITNHLPQSTESCEYLISEPFALDCALSIGALFYLLETGAKDTADFALYYARLCALVNQTLSCEESQSTARQMVVIKSVSSLAIVAGLLGNYSDWYVHLQGLKSLVESLGGQERLLPNIRTLVRKADLIGCVGLATKPIFPFIRFNESANCTVPAEDRQRTRQAVIRSLLGTGITTCAVENFVALAHYIQVVDYALSSNGDLKFDINALAEDWFSIQHCFLIKPSPIRNREVTLLSHTKGEKQPLGKPQHFSCSIDERGRDEWSPGTTPKKSDSVEALSTSLRLTGLLCMVLHGPRIAPYKLYDVSMLLHLLLRNMRAILNILHAQTSTEMVDSSLSPDSTAFSVARTRQALIWICLGAEYVWRISGSEGWRWRDLTSDYAVVRQLLVEVVGNDPPDAALVTSDDLQLCNVFDFMRLNGGVSNGRERILKILEVEMSSADFDSVKL